MKQLSIEERNQIKNAKHAWVSEMKQVFGATWSKRTASKKCHGLTRMNPW
jgi:hypothetical protein